MAKTMYKVQVGAFRQRENADRMAGKIKAAGIPAAIVTVGDLLKVQCGAFSVKANAEKRLAAVKKAGWPNAVIITVPGTDPAPVLTGPDKVLAVMRPYIDSKTAHADFITAYNKFIDEYNKFHGTTHSKIDSSAAWCTEFVDLAFYRADMLDLIGYGKQSGTLMETGKKNGTWKAGHDGIQYGDVVIYQDKNGNPNHTEFALGPHDFVSGNYKGGVHKRHRSSLGSVKGRIRPHYK